MFKNCWTRLCLFITNKQVVQGQKNKRLQSENCDK